MTCAVGHAFAGEALEAERLDAVRRSLWAAVNALSADATGLRAVARQRGDERMLRLAEESLRHSDTVRELARAFDARAGERSERDQAATQPE
ncbi:hypothetical protein [Motilibacter deserti]|uniref:ANTAR domain-containing protein n=1 Tax=Motilibacter deserti TaxID=2714956 RepID=A0ABX0H2Z9_9ACTN|nr:hypothetical protein [Motilibacter deserti]NHC16246.1 hypothetical protein [Motilibacter deserti]